MSQASEQRLRAAAELWLASPQVMVVTGAGVSTASGIADYRSQQGRWNEFDPWKVSSVAAFRKDPAAFWRYQLPIMEQMREAQPNGAHQALAWMEQAGLIALLLTQNIDGLHQRAGSSQVLEAHGGIDRLRCGICSLRLPWGEVEPSADGQADCPRCGYNAPWRAATVLFGEALAWKLISRAQEQAEYADLLVVVGSTMEVPPVGNLPVLTRYGGGKLLVLNQEPTRWDEQAELVLSGDAAQLLPQLAQEMYRQLSQVRG